MLEWISDWMSRGALPEDETIDWLFEVFAWLLEETGGCARFVEERRLVLPTDDFFPISRDQPKEQFAQAMFDQTRQLAGMADIPCKLVALEEGPTVGDLVGNAPHRESGRSAAGVFQHGAGAKSATIRYAPSGLADLEGFVATLAHELGHLLIHGFETEAPGSEEAQEPATDVCAIFLGFGVFTANAAFHFKQYENGMSQGWSISRLGYLDEQALAYALAIFLELLELDLHATKHHLRPNPSGNAKYALRHLKRERAGDLESLRRVAGGKKATPAKRSRRA